MAKAAAERLKARSEERAAKEVAVAVEVLIKQCVHQILTRASASAFANAVGDLWPYARAFHEHAPPTRPHGPPRAPC